MDTDAMQRIKIARSVLLQTEPFFGQTAMMVRLEENPSVRTLDTDGTTIRFNPEHVVAQSAIKLRTHIAHEVLHDVLEHPWRVRGRNLRRANRAGDYVVNGWLMAANCEAVKNKRPEAFDISGLLYDPKYDGLSFETVYSKIEAEEREEQEKQQEEQKEEQKQQEQEEGSEEEQSEESEDRQEQEEEREEPGDSNDSDNPEDGDNEDSSNTEDSGNSDDSTPDDGNGDNADSDGDSGEDSEGGDSETGTFSPAPEGEDANPGDMTPVDWQEAAEEAALTARKAGLMPGEVYRAVKDTRETQTPWQVILRDFVEQTTPSDYSWCPPNRRFLHANLCLPGMLRTGLPRIGVGIDLSGSITQELADMFTSELSTILEELMPECLEVALFDTEIRSVQEYYPGDIVRIEVQAGGGTSFDAVLEHFEQDPPACVIMLTDLEVWRFPPEPSYPVLWCTPEHSTKVAPYGETVRLSKY